MNLYMTLVRKYKTCSDSLHSLATWDMTLIYDPNSILQEPEYELI